ncbi:conserved hypothetical protein [Paraburkholderia ribeironis]|uniref:SnoaL-like domain-containing protein n=1 Tax=Paraburkholderia ribeironis TaxID=1247936 RepID=A0A1N7SPJ5_9BURK|nr:nuclear transport factor 2 family protein [Paraburkholderia ribeironis]SIT49240.1 conserved hypothetical protein [Paraburkholderia ribeironis]
MANSNVITRIYQLLESGDTFSLLDLFHPEITWNEAESNPYHSGNTWHGRDAVKRNLLSRIPEDWLEFGIHPSRFHLGEGVIIVEVRYKGTHRRTGRALDAQACHIWTTQDGKVTSFQQYTDTAKLRRAMGFDAEFIHQP